MSSSPRITIPAFDNTLGTLFIGSTIATILYGVICLQMFLYITTARSVDDQWWFRALVYLLFALDSAHQLTMTATMYKFLVSDYSNPALLPSGGAGSGEIFSFAQSCLGAITTLFIQLFFCWRIWIITNMTSLKIWKRLLLTGLTVSLALVAYAVSMDLAVTGFNHRILTANTPTFTLAYKLTVACRISYDVMLTVAMTISLHCARARGLQNTRTDHIITLLILFTVNTNLLTTCLSITELVTYLTLPNATVYGAIGFIIIKTYFNSFLAVLNSRNYLREKLDQNNISAVTTSQLREGNARFTFLPQHNVDAAMESWTVSAGGTTLGLSTIDHKSDV